MVEPVHIVSTAGLIYGVNEGQPISTLCGAEILRTASDFPIDPSRPLCEGCAAHSASKGLKPNARNLDPSFFGGVRTYNVSANAVYMWADGDSENGEADNE